jgi:hypothetical protein
MIKIYEIPGNRISSVKAVLEAPDVAVGEIAGVTIEAEAGKKGAKAEAAKAWKANEFKKQGFLLRDSKALGFEKACTYLQIEASDDFFKRNEKALVDAGAKALAGKELEAVKAKIAEGEEAAAESIGALFG